ncbi:LysR family transcriptional regulator [Agrobacterium salinitolerans]|uniref:LysR family transcriptional regulator n=2 Tax=Rhizobiaceae TaxID=82115 RepID=UPI0022B84B6E|nr:LysR family transcriptional regulator [Agrobacterium salinitolerans]MCZ7889962.1 LysR family transcriptional regulator [Agrobacterium salinitolerans]
MDIRQLKYFVAAAKLENLSAAADKLHVTHPALGQQIKKLEEELSVQLFERHSRGVSLTRAGHHLVEHAEAILHRFAVAKSEMGRFSSGLADVVSIGVTPSLGRVFVPTLLDECTIRHPGIRLNFVQGYADHLERMIHDGELDVSFVHSRIDSAGLESVPLIVETLCLIGTPALLADVEDPVEIETLVKLPLILDRKGQLTRRVLEKVAGIEWMALDSALEVQAINIRREFLMQGKRCAIAPIALFSDEIREDKLVVRQFRLDEFTRTLGLATPRVESLSPALSAIRKIIIEIVESFIQQDKYGWRLPQSDW